MIFFTFIYFCFIGLQELASKVFTLMMCTRRQAIMPISLQIASAKSVETELRKLIQSVSYRKAALTDSIRIRFEFEP